MPGTSPRSRPFAGRVLSTRCEILDVLSSLAESSTIMGLAKLASIFADAEERGEER